MKDNNTVNTKSMITAHSYAEPSDESVEEGSDKKSSEINTCDLVRFLFDILL